MVGTRKSTGEETASAVAPLFYVFPPVILCCDTQGGCCSVLILGNLETSDVVTYVADNAMGYGKIYS